MADDRVHSDVRDALPLSVASIYRYRPLTMTNLPKGLIMAGRAPGLRHCLLISGAVQSSGFMRLWVLLKSGGDW